MSLWKYHTLQSISPRVSNPPRYSPPIPPRLTTPPDRSYTALPPSTRLTLGLSLMAAGAIWAYLPDTLLSSLGKQETEAERREVQKLKDVLPRVRVVEKDEAERLSRRGQVEDPGS